jgi:membrane protein required for colicin V production
MTIVDWVIVVFLVVSVVSAARSGLILEVCSLAGLILGLMVASWNYQYLGPWMEQWMHSEALAQAAAFTCIFVGVMIGAAIVGRILRWSITSIGLGWADRIAGAAFGLVKGCALVTIAAMVIAAFWPSASWFNESYLAPSFLTMADHVAVITPSDLKERIRHGVTSLMKDPPEMMKPVV